MPCAVPAPAPTATTARSDSEDEEPFPIWKGMSAFEDAETGSEAEEGGAPVAGVIVVDPFCDYLGKRCIDILEEAGYAVVQASNCTLPRKLFRGERVVSLPVDRCVCVMCVCMCVHLRWYRPRVNRLMRVCVLPQFVSTALTG